MRSLDAMQSAAGPGAANITSFFPDFSRGFASEALWTIPVITFCVYLGVQWWAFWYPGAEPGGGGYVAQRILSARNERDGLLSVLWFNFAHYALRSWPWILAALAVAVLYPNLAQPESGYVRLAVDHLPRAARGLLVAGFLAAFMSTIATHLNWGSSYLVSDFYRRFVRRDASEKHYVGVSRWVTILLVVLGAWVSWELVTIRAGWEALLEVGAGTGSVYLLRWYWWRINAWSEIAAMTTALVVTLAIRWTMPFQGSEPSVFAKQTLRDDGAHHRRVGDRHPANAGRAARNARAILSPGSPRCLGLGADRAKSLPEVSPWSEASHATSVIGSWAVR